VSIFQPQWWHLSPCFGAALQCSPFKNNMIRLAQSIQETQRIEAEYSKSNKTTTHKSSHKTSPSPLEGPCRLMQCLFFQAQPGAPIRLTKSKSMAAAYLTPQIMGTLMGLALNKDGVLDVGQILFDRYGIKSNRIHGNWTGVSLARWKEIIHLLKVVGNVNAAITDENTEHDNLECLLTAAIWSMAVWECSSQSRKSLLEYFLASEEVSGLEILDPSNIFVEKVIQADSAIQSSWILMDGDEEILSTRTRGDRSKEAIQPSLEKLLGLLSDNRHDASLQAARALEDVCTAILSQQESENVKPTTPNGYYGFDGGKQKPDCVEVAVRELIDYLIWDDQAGKFDISRLPSSSCPELVDFYKRQNAIEGGEEWFHIMSDIPGCLYLTSSPNGRPYELTPTLRNIAKVCQRLMYNNGSLSKPIEEDKDWESLSQLQEEWEHGDVQLSFDLITEKAKMSSDIHVHEVVTVKRKGKRNAIEMRLRCDWARNTGFATVTHLRLNKEVVDAALLVELLNTSMRRNNGSIEVGATALVAIPLLSDFGVLQQCSGGNLSELVFSLLACRYGIDRREMLHITATSDLEREEVVLLKAQRDGDNALLSSDNSSLPFPFLQR
jgi:hypothetical protein